MYERRSSTNYSPKPGMSTPTKTVAADLPNISRYGRSHKPKMQDDFVSTDKKVSAYLKLSPGNQIQHFSPPKEQKKKASPKKVENKDGQNTPRRGRPPKTPTKDSENTSIMKMELKLHPQDPSSPVDGCEWMVGDMAWARVGGHPFWPCIVALDPLQKIFTKIIRKGRNMASQRWVHVQFFGDNGRRSWLNSTAIMSYHGRDAFIQLGDTILAGMRKKEPKQTSAFVIKPAVVQVWEKAVQEAEDMVNVSREGRVAFFTKHFPPAPPPATLTRDELIEKALESSTPPKNRGRKRKADQSPAEEESKKKQIKVEDVKEDQPSGETKAATPLMSSAPRTIADRKKRQALLMQLARSNQQAAEAINGSPTDQEQVQVDTTPKQTVLKRSATNEATISLEKKKPKKKFVKKKLSADYQAFSSKHFDRVSDDHPELDEKEINKYLQKMWNEMDETQKARYRSRFTTQEKDESESAEESEDVDNEETEEVRSSKSSSPAPLAVATQKTSSIKRNNAKSLFSGAKAEKACQICEKPGDTVRCRGPCQGYYHSDCITNPPIPVEETVATPGKKGKKRGRPRKSLVENSPSSSDLSQSDEQMEIRSEIGKVEKKDQNATVENGDVEVEVVEPESKSSKGRKGSKDSESGSGEEGEGFRCKDCQQGRSQPCFICQQFVQKKTGEAKLYRCVTAYCGKVYHEECLKPWPQTCWRSNGNGKGSERGVLTCPQHTCHTCASDNPGVIKARYNNDKLVRCMRCPTTYHYGNYCLPAGADVLTNTQIICPQHYQPPKKALIQHVNAAWCFICASGGSLICCDLCPTAFHAGCLNISTPPDGSYVCEDCLTGRFPLYGEIVWVKLGTYRWWPAEILYPSQIPDNILNLPHVRGEFAVRFFGSHDHYWVNRGRVFLYQDGDTAGKGSYKKSSVDHMFERAVREASEAQRKYLEEKATRDAETRPGMKPPNYVKLKTNKPVGNIRPMELNISSLTPCECDPKSEAPCAPESDCLNRILMVECNPLVCPAGEKCRNQLFEKRLYPPLQPYQTQARGWGLKTLVPLKKGDFVIEYVGEMIDEDEYKRRVVQMHENNEENFYFLTIDKDRMLDAGPKGNVSRFMNHSCQPNCETQKWTVNGDTRVGLFALHDIPADTELVFNYNLESTGSDKKPCMCGAPNCSGFIGVKAIKNLEKEDSKEKKPVKKKKSVVAKNHEEECFMCGGEGELLLCDGKYCTKGYHLSCLGKKNRTQGYWLCPWHQCNVCNKGRVQRCTFCVNSYCQEHSEGNIRLDPDRGLLCAKHDSEKPDNTESQPQTNGQPLTGQNGSEAMEVDVDVSEISSTASSQTSVETRVEQTNNNVIKEERTPSRRSRRSKSCTSDSPLVNGAVNKLSKRKERPASVDDKLIVDCNKTEQNGKQSPKPGDGHEVVKDIIDHIVDSLPVGEKNLESDSKVVENASLSPEIEGKESSVEGVSGSEADKIEMVSENETSKLSEKEELAGENEKLKSNVDKERSDGLVTEIKHNLAQKSDERVETNSLNNDKEESSDGETCLISSDETECKYSNSKHKEPSVGVTPPILGVSNTEEVDQDQNKTAEVIFNPTVDNIAEKEQNTSEVPSVTLLCNNEGCVEKALHLSETSVQDLNTNANVDTLDAMDVDEDVKTAVKESEPINAVVDENDKTAVKEGKPINGVVDEDLKTAVKESETINAVVDEDVKTAVKESETINSVVPEDAKTSDEEGATINSVVDEDVKTAVMESETITSVVDDDVKTADEDVKTAVKESETITSVVDDDVNTADEDVETTVKESETITSVVDDDVKTAVMEIETINAVVEDDKTADKGGETINSVVDKDVKIADKEDETINAVVDKDVKTTDEGGETVNVIVKNHSDQEENCVPNQHECLEAAETLPRENTEKEAGDKNIADSCKNESQEDGAKGEENEQAATLYSAMEMDNHVDDFELSYSECSNDKAYKSVNSESSIEMKLTDCMSTEDEEISEKMEEINGKGEIGNCIEQSNAMEVA